MTDAIVQTVLAAVCCAYFYWMGHVTSGARERLAAIRDRQALRDRIIDESTARRYQSALLFVIAHADTGFTERHFLDYLGRAGLEFSEEFSAIKLLGNMGAEGVVRRRPDGSWVCIDVNSAARIGASLSLHPLLSEREGKA